MKKMLIGFLLMAGGLSLSSCLSAPISDVKPNLSNEYLREVDQVDPSHFGSDTAALSYLKQFCELRLTGGISNMDSIELVANKYCDSDLAQQLGVRVAPALPAGFDENAFVAKAKKIDPELFRVLEDGSFIEPVAMVNSLCSQSSATLQLHKNANDWETSFAKFALETMCPEKIPE